MKMSIGITTKRPPMFLSRNIGRPDTRGSQHVRYGTLEHHVALQRHATQ